MQKKETTRAEALISRVQTIAYGGDYNPEQWISGLDETSIWQEDIRLMRLAHVNLANEYCRKV